jgi:hypothetical protein
LPIALVRTWIARNIDPLDESALRRDFVAMNAVLSEVEARMREELIPDEFKLLSDRMGDLQDVIAIWSIQSAREAAWTNGTVVLNLDGMGEVERAFLETLDSSVGMIGRALLRRI